MLLVRQNHKVDADQSLMFILSKTET